MIISTRINKKYRSRNWILNTKNGLRISVKTMWKLLDYGYTIDDIFDD